MERTSRTYVTRGKLFFETDPRPRLEARRGPLGPLGERQLQIVNDLASSGTQAPGPKPAREPGAPGTRREKWATLPRNS